MAMSLKKKTEGPAIETNWQAVVGRSLAHMVLKDHDFGEADGVVDKAEFLMGLGLSRSDAARMLGSTDDSLRVSLAKRAKKGGRSAAKKSAAKRG